MADTERVLAAMRRMQAQLAEFEQEMAAAGEDDELADTWSGVESLRDGLEADLIRVEGGYLDEE